jgi:hypothetical protein
MKKLLTIVALLLVTTYAFGQQGFTYSYVDPCSKKLKTIYIQNNESVTVNYLGVIGTFNQTEFQNGTFSAWVQGVQTQVSSQPCDELKTQTQVTQNFLVTQNIISTLTSITAASTMNIASSIGGASNSIGNSVDNSSSSNSSPRKNNKRNNGNNQSNPGNQTNNPGSQTNGQSAGSPNSQAGGSTQGSGGGNSGQGGNSTNPDNPSQGGSGSSQPSVGSSGQSGSGSTTPGQPGVGSTSPSQPGSGQGGGTNGGSGSGQGNGENTGTSGSGSNGSGSGSEPGSKGGSGSNGTGSGGQGGATDTKKPDESTQKQTESGGGNGGTTNSVSNAAEASSSNGGSGGSKVRVGSLIGTGDIVAIRSAEDQSSQFKGTMSMTKANTNNTRAKGFLLNFTTSINNSNLTFYGAFSNKAKTNTLIVANSSMIDFDRNFFNTTTALESKRFGKLSLMGGLNFTAGFLADESFSNLSGVGGGFYPFKASKNLTGTVLLLGVYSPYTKFYEGKWWDSGILLVPFTSWDYAISKNFKYNVSFSGTYQVKGSVLNYQILTGGKILL